MGCERPRISARRRYATLHSPIAYKEPHCARSLDPTREHCGVADVRRRSECLEPRFCVRGNLETVDERVKRFARHAALSPGQRLQLLVRIRRAVTPHDGLNRLGEHFPVDFEIAGKPRRIDLEPGKTAPA